MISQNKQNESKPSNLTGDTIGFGNTSFNEEYQIQIDDLESKLDELAMMYQLHYHSGVETNRINLFDLFGLIETTNNISAITKLNPASIFDQIKIYVNGVTKQLYIYDATNKVWRTVSLS